MISWTLFKRTVESNYKIFLIFLAVLMLYFTIIIGMYDPSIDDSMAALIETLPKEFMAAFGFSGADAGLMSFIATYYYGFLILCFPMIYEIIISNRLIAKHVDNGSMAYLLATPHKRYSIALTQAKFLAGSLIVLIGVLTIVGIGFCEMMFPGELDIKAFLLLNLGALLLHLVISGIGFFASCLFNETKNSLAIGAGIPIAFLLIQMIANIGDKLENLKFVTLFTLFNPSDIIAGSNSTIICFSVLAILAVIGYAGGIYIFNKKDLPL
ncbi:MAG: ABC transporter permease subunit [Turicibacter sp.]